MTRRSEDAGGCHTGVRAGREFLNPDLLLWAVAQNGLTGGREVPCLVCVAVCKV